MTQRSRTLLAALATAAVGTAITPARATLVIDPNPDGNQTHIASAHHDFSSFPGHAGANRWSRDPITLSADAPSDTGSGYAPNTPSDSSLLPGLSLAPATLAVLGVALTSPLVMQW